MEGPSLPTRKFTAKRRCWTAVFSCGFMLGLAAISGCLVVYFSRKYVETIIPKIEDSIPSYRVDCHPDPGGNREKCEKRGCLWLPGDATGGADCTFPPARSYRVLREPTLNKDGGRVFLKKQTNFTLFGNDVIDVVLDVTYISRYILRLKFYDPHKKRHELPEDVLVEPDVDLMNLSYSVNFQRKPQFGVVVRRSHPDMADIWAKPNKRDLPIVFDSRNPGFVFSEQFLQLSTFLPSANVYGIGDQRHDHLVHDLQWTSWGVWNREWGEEMSPGSHPFLMTLGHNGEASGIYLRNSHAVEMLLQPSPAVTFRALGGILDFYIFLGPSPEDVVKQYTRIIGRPALPPYWALGLHFGREIFNESTLEDSVKRMQDSQIPYDSVHLGPSTMDKYRSFTYDSTKFAGLPRLIEKLHDGQGRRVVVTSWAAVSNQSSYLPFQDAISRRILIGGARPLRGQMMPGEVVYLDFSNPFAVQYWETIGKDFYESIKFDAVNLQFNSPLNYLDGSNQRCVQNSFNYPPYKPSSIWRSSPLFTKTLCLDAQQNSGLHYQIHNLYAYHQAKSAFSGFSQAFQSRRPFILTGSHSPGIGRFAAHLITNTGGKWEHMKRSIIGILELNMLGIPAAGSDICGHRGNSTIDLCRRWIQLGAFYPIARIFKAGHDQDQDPSVMGEEVLKSARVAFETRYQLLPYLYTLFYLASSGGGTVARPLFHEFSSDNKTWAIEDQFMWGSALLISPVLQPDNVVTPLYLPKGRWFDYYTGEEVRVRDNLNNFLPRSKEKTSLHVRGGHVIVVHSRLNQTSTNRYPLHLIVALNENNMSRGSLYIDDKESIIVKPPFGRGNLLNFRMEKDQLKVRLPLSGYNNDDKIVIKTVKFWGVLKNPRIIQVNSKVWPLNLWNYNQKLKSLDVVDVDINVNSMETLIKLQFS